MKPSIAHAIRTQRHQGFTLVEIMVTVAIVAMLAAIALPAYNDYIIQGRLGEGTLPLATKRAQMELWFDNHRQYENAPACADDSSGQFFDISCVADDGALTYTLTATGKNAMAGFTFTINQANAKGTSSVPTGWSGSGASCWIRNKGGSC